MVYLSRIYTKTGDDGTTGLGDGSRVAKTDLRVESYGTVDELNAVLGLLLAHQDVGERELLVNIQNDLFDVGADLCVPRSPNEKEGDRLRTTKHQIERLEKAIDRLNEPLKPLQSFILPGGSVAAAWCHLARTVCRRAERCVVAAAEQSDINPLVTIYLNRLSDLLFVMARVFNNNGNNDVLWVPGKSR